jgi:hypothetical protein
MIYPNGTFPQLERRDADFTVLLAISLTLAAIFIVAILIILCYKVFVEKKPDIISMPHSASPSIDEYKI